MGILDVDMKFPETNRGSTYTFCSVAYFSHSPMTYKDDTVMCATSLFWSEQ